MSDAPSLRPTSAPVAAISTPSILLIGAAILVVYLSTIGLFGLAEPDEARYAEIPREMLVRGDWITPHLNFVKYFEKPPLLYWLVALTYSAFGFSELAARLWPVLFAFLGMAVVFVVGRSMWNTRVAQIAVALLASCPLYFAMSQVLTLDMALSGLINATAGSFWLAYTQPQRRRPWVLLFYTALALAVLTKGPVAVILVGGIVASFIVLRWEWAILRWLISPLGIAVFLAIAAPWHVLVSQHNPEFVNFYVVDQHLKRYLSPDEHQQSIGFFVPILLAGTAPWSLMCLGMPALLRAYVATLRSRRASAATLYCTLWATVVFVFFSLSGSKLATYILPMLPPTALLLGRAFHTLLKQPTRILFAGGVGVISCALLMLVAAVGVREFVDDPNAGLIVSRLAIGAWPLLFAGALSVKLANQGKQDTALALLVGAVLSLQLVLISGRGLAQCYKPLGVAIHAQARPDDLVVSYRHFTQAIPLYSQRRTIMVATRGELEFGSRQGDQSEYFWGGDEELLARWSSPHRLFVVINRSELEDIQARLSPAPRIIASSGKKVVIVNFAAET